MQSSTTETKGNSALPRPVLVALRLAGVSVDRSFE
jgi:hypothetical protein